MQAQGIHLRRLIYISKEEYKRLRILRDSLVKRWSRFCRKRPRRRVIAKKERVGWPIRAELNGGNGRERYPSYEATRIWATRDSMMWKWRMVREYYRDFLSWEDDGNKNKKRQVYELMYS